MDINKKQLTEEDIKLRYITPAIENAGWEKNQIRCEYSYTAGRIVVRKKLVFRGSPKRVDYLLNYKSNTPLAIVEAKDNKHSVGAGMQQALQYADALDVPFVYSSNGDGFLEHDKTTGAEREISLSEFPSPESLWNRYKGENYISQKQEEVITEPYYFGSGLKSPRYYQRIAINRTIEAISKGNDRILLAMATGTGKTYTAFQIIYRLWKTRAKKKILYIADRNILIDQTMENDFQPFASVMTKITNRNIDSSYEVYMALYQQLVSNDGEDIYKSLKPNFFDLIIIDECHRGSANEDSNWRKILNYFSSATQIGLTATPKEDKYTSNINYFGEPIYTYSLKQGIEDGFLAPYRVIKVKLDVDVFGYRPTKGKFDIYGNEIEDREYNIKDFDRNIIIDDRTKQVAKRVSEFLKENDRFAKTIVFCVNINHAEAMRQALINENKDLVKENDKYVMRITGDNAEGKAQLSNFIDIHSKYPTIVTTSELMTTGVDTKDLKLIVLDNEINSIIKFKQIIGRGTRIVEGKNYFTIMDFRDATSNFLDPNFDGEPIQDKDFEVGEKTTYGKNKGNGGEIKDGEEHVVYRINDVTVKKIAEKVQYLSKDGKLITESLKDFSKKNILQEFSTLDMFISKWNSEQKKEAILNELIEHGVFLDELKDEVGKPDIDDFDLICHIAFDKPPLTKQERADRVIKRGYLFKYNEKARQVLEALLDKYMNEGLYDLQDTKILDMREFEKFGSSIKIVNSFGGKKKYIETIKELEKQIYV